MAETNIILWLQTLSNPVLDYIMLGLTQLGSEILFLVAAVILYWCVDKKFAFRFMNVYILGVSLNEGLKAIIRRPRPFVAHPDEIRSIGDPTHGYSMPSGHSQSIANVSVQVCRRFKGTKAGAVLLPFGVYLTIIVMFTRMYLGQHYLTDVLVGCAVGILSALLFFFAFLPLFCDFSRLFLLEWRIFPPLPESHLRFFLARTHNSLLSCDRETIKKDGKLP